MSVPLLNEYQPIGNGQLPNERGRLRCHKRPKSREETPKEGISGNKVTAPQ